MGVVSRKPVRSVSLPCRSHDPRSDRMEKLLNMIKTWESTSNNPSAEIISSGFSHLTALYECLEDLVNTNLSQISTNMKWTDELLDISVKFLDICSHTTDLLSRTKQHLSELGCDLRRNYKGVSSFESITARYISFRNKLRKDIKQTTANLKQVENIISSSPYTVFRDVAECNTVIFRFLLQFLAVPLLKTNRQGSWNVVSRFLSGGKVVPEERAYTNYVNDLQSFDDALLRCSTCCEKQEILPHKLEALEATLEGLDSHLQLLSRRLIATRVSLLNMASSC